MTVDTDKLALATEKGATEWLWKFIRNYLKQLVPGEMPPDAFAAELGECSENRV